MASAAQSAKSTRLTVCRFQELIPELCRRGYQVIGPKLHDGAVVFDRILDATELPAGWGVDQAPGRLRMTRRTDGALFAYGNTAQGLKRFLHPPDCRLLTAERDNGSFRVVNASPTPSRYAFLGVRACDLAALERLDHVFLGDQYVDSGYAARRRGLFLIAVACTECSDTCFCSSMGVDQTTCPGCDIQLTEHPSAEDPYFVAITQTAAGVELLDAVGASICGDETEPAAAQVRRVDTRGLREALYDNFENPRWEETAARCLACGNCTSTCPTCFCTTVDDSTDITQHRAERWRRWDSCFTQNFSYIHGGSVRLSVKSRYRQWVTHKFAAWVDQFGTFGCVGCGRCITWCPARIDITEEIAALRG
jgi:hypothetical protein